MSQITTGIRAILSNPYVYEFFQKIMGATKGRKKFISEFIAPYPVNSILDIGCGPADILASLPDVTYYGFDISERYIKKARGAYGSKGNFFAKHLTPDDIDTLPKFDLVLLTGVLHHVDDETGINIMKMAQDALKPKGRLITTDCCLVDGQNPLARFLINKDRGQNIKSEEGYLRLARSVFKDVGSTIHHQAWIPYTHCFMVCTK